MQGIDPHHPIGKGYDHDRDPHLATLRPSGAHDHPLRRTYTKHAPPASADSTRAPGPAALHDIRSTP